MKLIPEWRQHWRFNSVRLAAVLVLLSAAQADLLPLVQPIIPAKYWPYVTFGLGAAIWVFRILQQQGLHQAEEPKQ